MQAPSAASGVPAGTPAAASSAAASRASSAATAGTPTRYALLPSATLRCASTRPLRASTSAVDVLLAPPSTPTTSTVAGSADILGASRQAG